LKTETRRTEPRLARPGAWAGLWRRIGRSAVIAAEGV
jgi:hypothetical protein